MDVKSPEKNPRYAAALRYRPEVDQVPVVVASGQGDIAALILKLAEEAGVPTRAEPDLAKVLAKLEPGTPIPEETYRLVAGILAFIWSIDQSYHNNRGTSR